MSDERLIGVIAEHVGDRYSSGERKVMAIRILAALRGDGFDVCRPDECESVEEGTESQ